MRNHLTHAAALAALLLLSFSMLGAAGCPTRPTDPAPVDYDEIVEGTAAGLIATGETLRTTAPDFDSCVVGVVLQAVGDGALSVALPIKASVEAGECAGEAPGFAIDPSPCLGLPGTPETPEQVDAALDEVALGLALALPPASMGAGYLSTAAQADGDVGACVALALLRDLLDPAGGLAEQVLAVVEDPGSPFTVPPAAWDCSACIPGAG